MNNVSLMNCTSLVCAVSLGILGCSSNGQVDLGTTAKTGEKLSDYVAVWDGHAEAHQYSSGSDRFRLSVTAEGDGVLELGEVAEAVPATSATDPVPGKWPAPAFTGSPLFEGFSYPINDAQVEASRLTLRISYVAPYADWCALQTPVASGSDYFCGPAEFSGDLHGHCTDGSDQPVDCGALALCRGGVCACTSSSCEVTAPEVLPNQLDATLEDGGDTLTGTFVDAGDQRYTVRLTRQAN